MNMRELAVGILQVERDWAADLAGAAGDLGLSELEALREIDTNAMFRAGDPLNDAMTSGTATAVKTVRTGPSAAQGH